MKKIILTAFLTQALLGGAFAQGVPGAGGQVPNTPPVFPLANPNSHTWVAFGDSITANADTGNSSNGPCLSGTQFCQALLNGSYMTWASLYTGQRAYRYPGSGGNCGENGDTAAVLLTRVSCVLALSPDFVVMEIGGNDAAGNVACATFTATDRQIVQAFLSIGITVFEVGVYPRSSPSTYTTAQANLAQCYNQQRRRYAAENTHRGYYFVDIESVAVDPTQAAWASPSGCLTDGSHPAEACGSAMGALIAAQINAVIPQWRVPLYSQGDVYDAANNPGGNLLPNGTLTGSGGSASGGPTGTVANNSTLISSGLGGGTVIGSVGTLSDGRPNQIITLSGTYTGSNLNAFLFQDVTAPSNVAIGDVLEGQACINVGANTNISGINVRLLTTESATNFSQDGALGASSAAAGLPSAGWATGSFVCILTPRRTTTAIPTKVEIDVIIQFVNQAGSSPIAATIQVASASIRKVTP